MKVRETLWVGIVLWILAFPLFAAPRDKDWKKVANAIHAKQPKTALGLLKPIETAAFADRAWGEGTKALLMRVRLQNGAAFSEELFPSTKSGKATHESARDPFASGSFSEGGDAGNLADCVRQLDSEMAAAPAEIRPVLRWFQARWLLSHYGDNRSTIRNRSKTSKPSDDDIETWDSSRMLGQIDRYFQLALEDRDLLRKAPVGNFREVLGNPGSLGDSLRPTLYDLIAHSALEFLCSEFENDQEFEHEFKITAASPAFDGPDAFLAWKPASDAKDQPKLRALAIYQDLLAFHHDDADRSAFLHGDLERLRWAGKVAEEISKTRRHAEAIRHFIAANATHPLSADARQDDVVLWLQRKRTKEAHATALAGAEAFPDHPFGKMCRGIVKGMETEELHVETPSSWPLGGDQITILQKNLSHVWCRLYRDDWQPDARTLDTDPSPSSGRETDRLLKKKPYREWDVALPDERDYQEHSTNIDTPEGLEPGYYQLVVSGHKDFGGKTARIAMTGVHVSRLGLAIDAITKNSGRIGGFVVDAVSGAPAPGVKVGIWVRYREKGPLTKLESVTNGEGAFRTQSLDIDLNHTCSYLVVAEEGGQRAVCRGSLSSRSSAFEEHQTVTFFTDRGIYRPGQIIQFKGILCEADRRKGIYQTVKGKNLTVTLDGPNDQKVGTLEVVTNEFGSFTGSFTAPTSSLLGSFTISAGGLGKTYLRIEEYKRPTFTVEILAPAVAAVLGGKVEVKGIAKAYTGAPVDGGEVEWSVERTPFWTGWGAWNQWNDLNLDSQEIATGKAVTAADGSFTITFNADPDEALDPAMDPLFSFSISADVTDRAGESRAGYSEVCVGHSEFNAEVKVDEWQETGEPVEFEVTTQTHDGVGRPADGTLRIYKLKEPAVCPLKFETIDNPSPLSPEPLPGPEGWELGKVVREVAVKTEKQKDSDDCLAKVSVSLPAGIFRAVFESRDSHGQKVEAITGLQVVDPSADRFATKIPFFTGAPNWTREPGEAFTILWGSGFQTARACVEWYKDGNLIKREWSTPGRTQQVFSFTPDESMRGGFNVRVLQFSMNRFHSEDRSIEVPWTNKEFTLRWEHLTSKLEPGAKDTWTAVVTGPDGAPAASEMVATLYDASLDDLASHSFGDFAYRFRSERGYLGGCEFSARLTGGYADGGDESDYWGTIEQPFRTLLPGLDDGTRLVEIGVYHRGRLALTDSNREIILLESEVFDYYQPPELPNSVGSPPGLMTEGMRDYYAGKNETRETEKLALAAIPVRRKLQETAFFYPQLTSGPDGVVRMSFTMPEGLGKWRFLGFAHDAAMRHGSLEGETITAKDLMVQPNPPRFLREGDALDFTVRISNQSDHEQSGTARLSLTEAATEKDSNAALGIVVPEQSFVIPAKESRTLSWHLAVPDGCGFLRYKAVATCGTLSDGEEGWLPVLSRRILVTDSLSLPIREAGTRHFTFEKLRDSGKSDTLKSQFLEIQAVSQPAWNAVMALPYLMEYPHDCAEQTFNRYYANALGRHLVRSNPKIREVFDQWRSTAALDSPLAGNRDLKGILLEETPWLQDASDESTSRHRVAMLFEENQLDSQLAGAIGKLEALQRDDGLWPWFSGGGGSEYVSLYIAAGFGRLRSIGVETDVTPALKALSAFDAGLTERRRMIQNAAKKDASLVDQNHLDPWIAHHLYSRSFFLKDRAIEKVDQAAHDYFIAQAKEYWPRLRSPMSTAQVALALWRAGDAATARLITRSLRETAINHPDSGMSWPTAEGDGWWWWQAPIETQAMIIEAFQEIDHDAKAVEDCRVWLIQQKQLRDWGSTKATADAVNALLSGPATLSSEALLKISLGGTPVDPGKLEAGTGFYERRFSSAEVKPEMAEIDLTKSDPGVAWASVHWQYLEDLSKLTGHGNANLKLEKSLFVRRASPEGPRLEPLSGPVRVGEELVTRLSLRNDRAMEFLHLKDARGSGTEPVNVLSGQRWQDGLGYYEVTRDTASHFFIELLPPGTHVFETSVRVQHAGSYQTGIAEIRSMYAPEFQARSGSVGIEVMKPDAK